MIISRPVQYTSRVGEYRELLLALGLSELPRDDDGDATQAWWVFQAGSGRVALHAVDAGDALDGGAALGFETDELDAVADRLAGAAGIAEVRRFGRSGGKAIEATASDGLQLVLLAPTAGAATAEVPELASLGLWVTPDVPAAATVLGALGLTGTVASDGGGWFQATAGGGGLAAAHDGTMASAQLSFEYDGDVEVLKARLEGRGAGCALVDESYGRTLLVDRPGGGDPLWINERQTDLYGYVALA